MSSEAELTQRGHSQLWSQMIPGGGACGDTGTTRPRVPGPVLPQRALSQLLPSLSLGFPLLNQPCRPIFKTLQLRGRKTRLRAAVKPAVKNSPRSHPGLGTSVPLPAGWGGQSCLTGL